MKKIMVFSLFLILIAVSFVGCGKVNNPNGPEPIEPPQYRALVLVTYDRDPAKIRFPEGNDSFVLLHYLLFDPNAEQNVLPSEGEGVVDDVYRQGGVCAQRVANNRYQYYLKKVLIQSSPYHPKHSLYVDDPKLWDGVSDESYHTNTNTGITVEGAYDVELSGYYLFFKMSK